MPRRAVLLLNLGSPDSIAVPDVKRYLREFLNDERVIDRPGQPWRWMLVNWLIVPFRGAKSAHAYSRIWTKEGSPLVVTSQRVRDLVQSRVDIPVAVAMNYGNPTVESALRALLAEGAEEVLLFPQYPHYAMSSWETVVAKVYRVAAEIAPRLRFSSVLPFFGDEDYIEALVASAKPYLSAPYDHLLFSYHGIPVRHLTKADSSHAHCQMTADCCTTCSTAHATCYKAQVTRTTHLFAAKAGLDAAKWSISFQSRLGREPWIKPYTDFEFARLAAEGKKRLVVITPAFVTDCLETLEEIRMTGSESFLRAGGESFTHIPCLNDQLAWVDLLSRRIEAWNMTKSAQKVAI